MEVRERCRIWRLETPAAPEIGGRGRAWLMVDDQDVVVGDGDGGVKSCDGDGGGVDDRSWRWR